MAISYDIDLTGDTSEPDLVQAQSMVEALVRGQVKRHDPTAVKDSYGVETTSTKLFTMALRMTLPDSHDAWFPDAVRSLEHVRRVEIQPGQFDYVPTYNHAPIRVLPQPYRSSGGVNAAMPIERLPNEIRCKIWSYVIETDPLTTDFLTILEAGKRLPSVCFVNKQTMYETVEIEYNARLKTIAAAATGGIQPGARYYQQLGGLREVRYQLCESHGLRVQRMAVDGAAACTQREGT